MAERIIASFRLGLRPASELVRRGHVERARALIARVEARGGALVAWGGSVVSFSLAPESFEDIIGLARSPGEETFPGEEPYACGVAQGELGPVSEEGAYGELSWGLALVAAEALSELGGPGDVVVGDSLRAYKANRLLTLRKVHARRSGVQVHGALLDTLQPWRRDAENRVAKLKTPALVTVEDPKAILWMPGTLSVLRADPGLGGTRFLREVAGSVRPSHALVLSPSGSGMEPLGALRRAIARAASDEVDPFLLELAREVEQLVRGEGIPIPVASKIITAFLWPKKAASSGTLLVDDAQDVDVASLEACAGAIKGAERAFGFVVRLDATTSPPAAVAHLEAGPEIELRPMTRESAEELAKAATGGLLDAKGCARFARLGSYAPLGIVEAIAHGTATGKIAWYTDRAEPRTRASGKGKPHPATHWIAERALDLPVHAKVLLCAVALLGGETSTSRLFRVLQRADPDATSDGLVADLSRARWLDTPQVDWVGLPSRTHRDTLSEILDDGTRQAIHRAICDELEEREGPLGKAEAAWHAAGAGDSARASRLALGAAVEAQRLGLEQAASSLLAFARREDPTCEVRTRAQLASTVSAADTKVDLFTIPPTTDRGEPSSASTGPRIASPPASTRDAGRAGDPESEPPTVEQAVPLEVIAPKDWTASPSSVGEVGLVQRLSELAKNALLSEDTTGLEKWLDGLSATGEKRLFADRMQAMARLNRGEIGDALRVLRKARQGLGPEDVALRCQTSLALAVALAAAGRPDDALLEGLDALARARERGDRRGIQASLVFLSKLFAGVSRGEEAQRLRSAV